MSSSPWPSASPSFITAASSRREARARSRRTRSYRMSTWARAPTLWTVSKVLESNGTRQPRENPAMTEPILRLDDIHTYYGESYILQGVSLTITPGEVVALLGRNGVGKTTTIRSIMGVTPIRRGQIFFAGTPIHHAPAHRIARLGIGWVPQGRRIFPNLAVIENLTIAARAGEANGNGWTLERVFEQFP